MDGRLGTVTINDMSFTVVIYSPGRYLFVPEFSMNGVLYYMEGRYTRFHDLRKMSTFTLSSISQELLDSVYPFTRYSVVHVMLRKTDIA